MKSESVSQSHRRRSRRRRRCFRSNGHCGLFFNHLQTKSEKKGLCWSIYLKPFFYCSSKHFGSNVRLMCVSA